MHDANQPEEAKVAALLKALGQAYLENGEHRKAAEKFRQLYDLGHRDPDTLAQYALALARSEALDDTALAIYSRAVEAVRDHEALYVTLSTLFLKHNLTEEPALKVHRQALTYSPPFEEQIRSAIEHIFHETTDTVTIPELRQTLMESMNNPELLSLYLNTVWQNGRHEEALHILQDLYVRSRRNPLYLRAICETLLERKAYAEAHGLRFHLSRSDVRYCVRYRNPNDPITRIAELDQYLDLRNLFTAFSPKPNALLEGEDEFEIFILDKAIESLDELETTYNTPVDVEANFRLRRDLVERFDNGTRQSFLNSFGPLDHWQNRLNAIALFEILNFDAHPDHSKLPFTTFLQLVTSELSAAHPLIVCQAQDGLLLLGEDPEQMCRAAVNTLQRLTRYNQVVDEFEVIHLKATVHCAPVPFAEMEHEGLRELRKAVKVHTLPLRRSGGEDAPYKLRLTENVVNAVRLRGLRKVGEFRLPRFPGQHTLFELKVEVENQERSGTVTTRFGKYAVQKPIRETALGGTYLGYDAELDRAVLIKAYNTQAFAGLKESNHLRRQFFEEVRKVNRFNYPRLTVIYDAGEQDDFLYLVREYVEGQILYDYLLSEGLPDVRQTLSYFVQLCRILEYLHAQHVWHKNLKPDNVFLTRQDEIKLTDIGLLQIRHLQKNGLYEAVPQAYFAPEQIQGMRLTAACDVFQVGVLLYESLTGIHPFRAQNDQEMRIRILADAPEPPSKIRHDISPELESLILQCLAKNPGRRFPSISQLRETLEKLANASHAPRPPTQKLGILK